MGIRHMAFAAALAAALSATLVAQPTPSGYHSISCVRVKAGKSAAFRALLSGDYSKIEQARVDSGAVSAWIALRTVIPAGTDAGCDYVLVTFYPGLPAAPLSDDEMTDVLQKAGVSSEYHEYPTGGHAWGFRAVPDKSPPGWLDVTLYAWLKKMGFVS